MTTISKVWEISNSFTNKWELVNFPLDFNNNDDNNIIPEQFTVKAQPALFEREGRRQKSEEHCIPVYIHIHILKPQNQTLKSNISQKRYEIERKCQWKLDRKSCIGFRRLKIFLTPGDLWRSRSNPENFEVKYLKNVMRYREMVDRS